MHFALLSSPRCWHAVCIAAPKPEIDHFVMAITSGIRHFVTAITSGVRYKA